MSIDVSLRASRSRAQPMPCRRASTRRRSKRPIGPISNPVMAAAAHTQAMSDRELAAILTRAASTARARCSRSAARPRCTASAAAANWAAAALACSGSSSRAKPKHQGTLLLECRESFGEVVWRPVSHARHERGQLGVAVLVVALGALDGGVVGDRGCRRHQLALLLERRFRLLREHDALQRFLADPADRFLRAAGELNDGRREQIDHRQRRGRWRHRAWWRFAAVAAPIGRALHPYEPAPCRAKLLGPAGRRGGTGQRAMATGASPDTGRSPLACELQSVWSHPRERSPSSRSARIVLRRRLCRRGLRTRSLTGRIFRKFVGDRRGRRRQPALSHHLPVLGIDAHGSFLACASPFCSSSSEMLSGERMNAMRPSRGGRLMVTPAFISRSQVA